MINSNIGIFNKSAWVDPYAVNDHSPKWNYPWWFFSMSRFNPGGPTYYGETVLFPADLYLTRSIMGIIATAITFLLVLVIILPIIKHRISSVIVAVNSVGIGVVISLCLLSPEWLRGHVIIQSPMNYYSTKQYAMSLGIHVGLASTNLTLKAVHIIIPLDAGDLSIRPEDFNNSAIFYNEEVHMYKPELFQPMMLAAMNRGLPIPLLTVIQFLTSATLGFKWSQDIMQAGYHSYWALSFALAGWILAILLIAAIPRYSCYAFIAIGVLMLATIIIYFYWVRLDRHFPPIYVAGQFIELKYGVCFWVCLAVGVWSLIYGFCFAVYDVMYPDIFLTIFDIDYDHKRALAAAHRLNRVSRTNVAQANMNEHYESPFEDREEHIPMQFTHLATRNLN